MTPTVPRFEVLNAPSHWRTVDFLSDLHLQASEPATLAAFTDYLAHTNADAVFLLGDIFEVWVGDDSLEDADGYEAPICRLLREASRQRPFHFMVGNRDFLAGERFLQTTGLHGLADPTVLVLPQGERLVLSHGDALCVDDVDYQRFRVQARSAAWQQGFLSQPLATRREQAKHIRSESEARKQSGAVYADVDTATALAWLEAAQAHTLVHGHTHRPAHHALDAHHDRWVLSDWDAAATPPRAEVLRWKASGGWQRLPVPWWPLSAPAQA